VSFVGGLVVLFAARTVRRDMARVADAQPAMPVGGA
jgi:hypothetical protein